MVGTNQDGFYEIREYDLDGALVVVDVLADFLILSISVRSYVPVSLYLVAL